MTVETMTRDDVDGVRAMLIVSAEMRHAEFPQYRGHWDGWKVARATQTLQWRGYPGPDYTMLREGDLVLVEPPFTRLVGLNMTGFRKAHLPDSPVGSGRGVDTMIPASALEVLG